MLADRESKLELAANKTTKVPVNPKIASISANKLGQSSSVLPLKHKVKMLADLERKLE